MTKTFLDSFLVASLAGKRAGSGTHGPTLSSWHLKCGQSELKCLLGAKHTSDCEDSILKEECKMLNIFCI